MLVDSSGSPICKDDDDEPARMVEIARSFSFKLNLGGYQSCDFFCSEKAQCAPADAEEVSQKLFEFCRSQVLRSVQETKDKNARKAAQTEQGSVTGNANYGQ